MKRTLLVLTLSFCGWTAVDAQNIEIESVSPAQNEANVSGDSDIIITFSEAVAGATVNNSTIQIRGEQTGLLTGAFTGGGTDEITFNPANDFKAGEIIRVTVTTSVEDATNGDTLAAPFSYSFTAAVDPAPEAPPFFDEHIVSTSANAAQSAYAADVNGDGHMDILSASSLDDMVAWYENDGSQSFTERVVSTNADAAASVYAADVNGDGDMDILSASINDAKVAWYENDGSQSFTERVVSTNADGARSVYAADVDGDGDMDILSASEFDHKIAWYENDGSQSFTERVVSTSADGAIRVYTADVDSDGDMDILSASWHEGKIAWYENDGSQSFTERIVSTNADGAWSVYAADVNGDGDMDILSASINDDKIAWYENDGSQNFTERVVSTNADGARSVYAADVDGDGHMDILSASPNEGKIAWYENDGVQGFTERVVSTTAAGANSVLATDVAGDGDMDILSASISDDKIAWYENTSIPIPGSDNPAGRSVSFSTSNNYIQISHDDLFNLPGAFTLETWIRVDAFDTHWQAILTKGENSWRIHRHSDSNTLAFGTQNLVAGGAPDIQGNADVNDGQWHHVAAVYNGTDEKRLYIDRMLDASGAVTGSLSSTSDPIWIGNNSGNNQRGWKGNIDEVRIWNDARTEEEIRQNMFQSLNGDEDGLVGYWKLDEEEGNSALDKTGNENHGFLTNGPAHSDDTHPYGTFITGGEGWRILTVPAGGVTYAEFLEPFWTQGFTGADTEFGSPNIFTYLEGDGNEDASGRGFQAITDASDTVKAGQAVAVFVFENDEYETGGIQGGFPKKLQTDSSQYSGTKAPTLSLTKSGGGGSYDALNDGWNLVGNPYGATIDWDAEFGWNRAGVDNTMYVWSDSAGGGTGAYLSWNGTTGTLGSGLIAPMQGFWVKANNTEAPSITVNDTVRSAGGFLFKKAPVPQLIFTLEGQDKASSTILMFSEEASLEKDRMDAYKLQSLNADYLSLFTQMEDGTALDINALPAALEEPVSIPMGFDGSNLSGEVELNWTLESFPEDWQFILRDNETGQEVDVREQSAFSFELAKAKSSKVLEALEDSNGLTPRHGVLTPKVMKAAGEETPRFTLTIVPGNVVSTEPGDELPQVFALAQNYPNPFNPSTVIRYQLPENSAVSLKVFDVLGREVAMLVDGERKAVGSYSVTFDARSLASGIYIYRLKAGNNVLTKKLTLIK